MSALQTGLGVFQGEGSSKKMTPERTIIARVLREIDPEIDRLFRINAGMGWIGRVVKRTDDAIIIANPRPLHAAPAGWPDLFGWRTVKIGAEHIGQLLAVVRAVEIKAGRDRLSDRQRKFAKMLEAMGGIYEIAR